MARRREGGAWGTNRGEKALEGIVGKKSRTRRGGNRWKIPGDFGRGEWGGRTILSYRCIGVDKLELISENKRAILDTRPRENKRVREY